MRRIFNVGALASLVAAVVVAGFWVRSCWRIDQAMYLGSTGRAVGFYSGRGTLSLLVGTDSRPWPRGWAVRQSRVDIANFSRLWGRFAAGKKSGAWGWAVHIGIPYWLLAAAGFVVPAFWLRARLRDRTLPRIACPSCGYDLRGTPAGACPECGEAVREAGREA